MYVLDLVKPGTRLKSEDYNWSNDIERLLSHIEAAFYEANVALNLFVTQLTRDQEQKTLLRIHKDNNKRELREREYHDRKVVEELVRKELGLSAYDYSERLIFETDVKIKQEKWHRGEMPESHNHCLVFIYAKSFLYALDTIEKFIKVLSREAGVPEMVRIKYKQIAVEFPDLKGVRNTTQHLEDRARGLGAEREPKPIKLKPISNAFINAPQGCLALNNLHGTKFGTTMANGNYGEVDVSLESLTKIQKIIQDILDAFEWQGIKLYLPY
ncbi:hypothetical protein AXA14_002712 [Escherichia coli]|nr:hypothetical protein [Escherichia coli]